MGAVDRDVRRPGDFPATDLKPALLVLDLERAGVHGLGNEGVGKDLMQRADPEVAEAGLETLEEDWPQASVNVPAPKIAPSAAYATLCT